MNSEKRIMPCLLWVAVLLTSASVTGADTRENTYTIIPQRNAFGLKEIPPPTPPNTNPPAPPPAQVKITGITTILSTARALLEYTEPGKQVQKPILTAGQRDGPIEVLEIDARAGSVKIRNGGVETLLTFDKDGIKPPSGPVPGAPGGPAAGTAAAAHPAPGMPIPPPSGVGAGYNMPKPGAQPYPTTRLNAGAVPSGGTPTPGAVTPNLQFNTPNGVLNIPTRPTRIPQALTSLQSTEMPISREDQIVSIEVKREMARQQEATGTKPQAPSFLYPTTPVTPNQ